MKVKNMNPKRITNNLLKEEYFYLKHPSGLDVYVYPKKGYCSNYAIFGTNFGSINNKFRIKGHSSYTEVPDGIAHYLEHKLFAGEEGDAFELFSKTGASANAFTTFDKTAYLFSCAGNIEKPLEILLDFVQTPYFTQENVDKERGIIAQEIKMYEDSPDWKVFINLLQNLYQNNPVRIDTAGTVETIAKITPEILYNCYNTFYNLNNMCLCVVGDVNCDDILELVDKKVKYLPKIEVERFFPEEPNEVRTPKIVQKFDIENSMFSLGFKESVDPGKRISIAKSVCNDLILSCLSSSSSEMYEELVKKDLISMASFSDEYLEGPGYASVIFSGESSNPEKASEVIKKHIEKIHKTGLDEKTFNRVKNAIYGQSLEIFNSVSSIARAQFNFAIAGKELFDYLETLQNISIDEVNKDLGNKLNPNHSTLSVVSPK